MLTGSRCTVSHSAKGAVPDSHNCYCLGQLPCSLRHATFTIISPWASAAAYLDEPSGRPPPPSAEASRSSCLEMDPAAMSANCVAVEA